MYTPTSPLRRATSLTLQATAVFSTIALLSACGGASTDVDEKITFPVGDQAMSVASASFATVPKTMGYFEEEGLDVTMQPVASGGDAVQAVSSGQGECTYASTTAALNSAAKDPNIVILGSTNGNVMRVAAPKSRGIESMKDLEGKTIGVQVLGSVSENVARGGLRSAGADVDDRQFLAVGYGSQTAQAFKSGDIDAYSSLDGPLIVIGDLLDEPLVWVESEADNLTGTSALICSRTFLKENPESVAGLWRSFFKGMEFSKENPEAAIRMHWKEFPSSKPGGAEDSVLSTALDQLNMRLDATAGKGSAGMYGQQTDEDLERTRKFYADNDVIIPEAAELSLDEVVDYSLVEKYNDFDVDAVRKQAQEWKE